MLGLATTLVGAALHNATARPKYRATAQILIEPRVPNYLPTLQLVDVVIGRVDYLNNQLQMLKGQGLAEAVVARLGPERSAELRQGPIVSPLEVLRGRLQGKADSAPPTRGPGMASALRSRISVETVADSTLVNVHVVGYDPDFAADAANALTEAFIEHSRSQSQIRSAEATEWLSGRIVEQKEMLGRSEQELQSYEDSEGVLNIEEQKRLLDGQLSTLHADLMRARSERMALQALLREMEGATLEQPERSPALPEREPIGELRAERSRLARERVRLSETLAERHPAMLENAERIEAVQASIVGEVEWLAATTRARARLARERERALGASVRRAQQELQGLRRQLVEYRVLERDVDANQQLLGSLVTRTKETSLQRSLETTNVRHVGRAEAPTAPFSPNPTRTYQLALLFGIALSVGVIVLIEHLDDTVKGPEDIKSHLQLPLLGALPDFEPRDWRRFKRVHEPPLIFKGAPPDVAEAFRVVRTNLLFCQVDSSSHVFLVSSVYPEEGKSTSVANLAVSLAQNGARVLAIDADLRRPTLHKCFGVASRPGLSERLAGEGGPSKTVPISDSLHLIPCGRLPPNPAELLGSQAMKKLLASARREYEWILIDAPPIMAMADAAVLCGVVDGLILVVAAERTSRPAVASTVDSIVALGARVTGVVLNRVNLERNSYQDYYYSAYYHGYHRPSARAGRDRPAGRLTVPRGEGRPGRDRGRAGVIGARDAHIT